jgi:K+-transporting ATPase ATPase A chain
MTFRDFFQLGLLFLILLISAKPLGLYLFHVLNGEKTFLQPVLKPVEHIIYRICGIQSEEDQTWPRYTRDLLLFSSVTFVFTYLVLRFQPYLPLNPQNQGEISWHLNFNTSMSFMTNTNWQSYSGESTLSYFSQMIGLTFQNFVSAAVGLAVSIALIRGLSRKEAKGIGNFWVDLVRSILYILLPLSFVFAIILISQGTIQNFQPYVEALTLEGVKQTIGQGPVASQVAIKMLGTNGGGFFNANAAHPYENPTPLSNFLQMLSIFLIPSALVYVLGVSTQNKKHGWSVWATMAILFLAGTLISAHFEYQGNPLFTQLGCTSSQNWEGKETRFGIFNSALFSTITTDASCGAVNSMHDSMTPLGGLVPLVNMMLGEVVFGGVGAGLYGMVLFIILTVFIAGLMVGRTPEYLGKKIEGREVKFAMLAVIVPALSILGFSAIASISSSALQGLGNPNAHGFSEVVYAYTSGTANNGSAFAGLSANTPFWNITLALAMFLGRFFILIPMLGVAGTMAAKRARPETSGSFPVHGPLFVILLLGVILIVGALTFLPALSLGPIVEHFQMKQGQLFQ